MTQDVVAKYLGSLSYEVSEEFSVGDGLVADVYGKSKRSTIIVEVETGYVPPNRLGDAERYLAARVLAKTLEYSRFADEFYIATPSFIRLPIPKAATTCVFEPNDGIDLLSHIYGRAAQRLVQLAGSCRGLSGLMVVSLADDRVAIVRAGDRFISA